MNAIIVRRRGIGPATCREIAKLVDGRVLSTVQGGMLYRKLVNTGCMVIPWGVHDDNADVNKVIHRVTNKRAARMIIHKAGVQVPEPVALNNIDAVAKNEVVVVRPDHHMQRRDYYECPPHNEHDLSVLGWFDHAYAAKRFDHDQEYRIHVAHGKVLFVQDKRYACEDQGWTVEQRKELSGKLSFIKMMRSALAAVDALKLDFGAVDILYSSVLNKHVVCEVNTAPGLSDLGYGRTKYAAYFSWLIRNNNPQHWNHKEFTKGESLIWKNFQLEGVV